MRKQIFIIEHLEPKLWRWCLIEYAHISKIAGKENVWFTNIGRDSKTLKKYGKVIRKSIKEINLKNACILDPESDKLLTPNEAKNFNYFIFGGILGDYPPKKRTKKELTSFIKNSNARNIGKDQLSTDNAVYVVNEIILGKNLKEIPFKKKIELKINKIESTILPFSYPLINGKPNISKDLLKYLKRRKDN